MKALALDFDGVIADSAAESFAMALRTYALLRPDTGTAELARSLEGLPIDALRAHAAYRAFVELMPLGNRAEDFAVALGLIESGQAVRDQRDYDAVRAAGDVDFLAEFHRRFYVGRDALREADPQGWTQLLAPFSPFLAVLRRRQADVALCIATAKDRPSVDLLLDAYGIADLFEDHLVFDKEEGVSKRAHLSSLQAQLCVDFADITFVDDKVNHLDDVGGLGVRGALASWGYNGERERMLAREAGHLVLALDDVESQLFGPVPSGSD